MIKRVFDVLVALLLLLLLALPLLAIAVWVRLDSPGPALYRQVRVGRHGQPFRIHKFRTMQVGADQAGPALTAASDPRITRAGAWLRARRLDELPQLLDVLRGHMSLVGPRPEVPRYVDHYPADLKVQVLAVRPGITDPASLAHRHEAQWLQGAPDPERLYLEQVLPAKLRLQADYARRATFWSDLQVLVRTAAVLMGR